MTTEIQAPEGGPALNDAQLDALFCQQFGITTIADVQGANLVCEWFKRGYRAALAAQPATVKQDLTVAAHEGAHYTVERHGNGWAIYTGRDHQHHGCNWGQLTECDEALAKLIERGLNLAAAPVVKDSLTTQAPAEGDAELSERGRRHVAGLRSIRARHALSQEEHGALSVAIEVMRKPPEIPTNEALEKVASGHQGHPADFAADVLERWGGWQRGLMGYGGGLNAALPQPKWTAAGCPHRYMHFGDQEKLRCADCGEVESTQAPASAPDYDTEHEQRWPNAVTPAPAPAPEPVAHFDGCVMVGYSRVRGGYCVYEETAPGEYCAIKGPFETKEDAESAMRDPNAPTIFQAAQAIEAPAPAPDAPAGMVLVPRELTPEMLNAGCEVDDIYTRWDVPGMWAAMLAAAPASQAPAVGDEREQLRAAQAAAVMPMIGSLLDAWEQADREVMDNEPELVKWLKAINRAMETAGDDEPAPTASRSEP